MSNYPRRSARLSPQLQQNQFQQKPGGLSPPAFTHSYSASSSTSTSSHPSPISDGLQPAPPPSTPQQPQPNLQIQPPFMSQHQQHSHLNAPLPSPSTADMEPFFGRSHSQPNPYTSQPAQSGYTIQQRQQTFGVPEQHFNQQDQQQYQQQYQQQPHQLHPHTNSMSQEHPAHSHGNTNPGQLPPNFLAEAAKRAELACLMRDFGDVSL